MPMASGDARGRAPASSTRRRKAARAGLTLLEVLGAVALLGILYTVLIGQNIQGVRAEGESRRRLEASLLADERMADLEFGLAAGTAPPLGRTETEAGDFVLIQNVTAFEPPPEFVAEDTGGLQAPPGLTGPPSLLSTPRGGTPALRTVELAVVFVDDFAELRDEAPAYAARTTYALDLEAAATLRDGVEPPAGEAR
jgi:type II secretory pathway pseudopilin PulG